MMRGQLAAIAMLAMAPSPAAVVAQITEVPCAAAPLAPSRPLAATLEASPSSRSLVAVGAAPDARPLIDVLTQQPFGKLPQRNRLLQQVDFKEARQQAELTRVLHSTTAELQREQQSDECQTALKTLRDAFESQRHAMHYPDEKDLAYFGIWYFEEPHSQSEAQAATTVVSLQRAYDAACLTSEVTDDMKSTGVLNAYAILSFDDKVICTGLRMSREKVMTARHCFANEDGTVGSDVQLALKGQGHYWVAYSGEPAKRFEVCANSLPTKDSLAISARTDHWTITTAPTSVTPPAIRWGSDNIADGASLYLRGYFAFAKESDQLSRLRSTAHGGCIATVVKGRCVFHGCQTTPAMSGAPIFLRPDDVNDGMQLVLVGFHLGPASYGDRPTCSFDGSNVDKSNFAYLPTGEQE